MASTERRMMSRLTTYSSCSKCRSFYSGSSCECSAFYVGCVAPLFEVRVTAEVRKQQRTLVVAVLQRKNPKDLEMLYTYWE